MKFKMAPNSLFAVLLRSPWWISFAIAIAFVALAHALLPPQWRVPGALGALPFAVIGAIALRRQWGAPSAGEAQAILDAAAALPWPRFKEALVQGFTRQGHTVEPAQGAADLRLVRGGTLTLVAARRWKAAHHGEEVLASLQAAATQASARAAYVCLGEPSPKARQYATRHGIELLQAPQLVALLRGVLPGR